MIKISYSSEYPLPSKKTTTKHTQTYVISLPLDNDNGIYFAIRNHFRQTQTFV